MLISTIAFFVTALTGAGLGFGGVAKIAIVPARLPSVAPIVALLVSAPGPAGRLR